MLLLNLPKYGVEHLDEINWCFVILMVRQNLAIIEIGLKIWMEMI